MTAGRPLTAAIFPGQGGDLLAGRLGRALEVPEVKTLLAHASAFLSRDLGAILAGGHPGLGRTEYAQPAVVAVSLGTFEALARAGEPNDMVAGHSLGDLSAAAAAGAIPFALAVELAVHRGRLMAEAARSWPGGMVAVTALDRAALDVAIERVGRRTRRPELVVSGRNTPRQWLVSGSHAALAQLASTLPVTPVPAGGPWHGPWLQAAQIKWLGLLDAAGLQTPTRALLALGAQVPTARAVTNWLGGQLTSPIDFPTTVGYGQAAGVRRWTVVGPGRAVRALLRQNLPRNADVRPTFAAGAADATTLGQGWGP